MDRNIDYWITNGDSLLHQIFMIVMASLYALAWILGVSYKAMNIYCYLVLFPLSSSLLFKGWKKILFIPFSLLFFLIPRYEQISVSLFNSCVDFLNYTAVIFSSDYITMSVYICVLFPVLLYVSLLIFKISKKRLIYLFGSTLVLFCTYMLLIYPNFKMFLIYIENHYL